MLSERILIKFNIAFMSYPDVIQEAIKNNCNPYQSINHCICPACEKDFKCNVGSEGYKPRWRSENKENNGFSRCSVKSCTQLSRIIHTNILTRDEIVELLQVELLNEPRHIITTLCTRHYKEVGPSPIAPK